MDAKQLPLLTKADIAKHWRWELQRCWTLVGERDAPAPKGLWEVRLVETSTTSYGGGAYELTMVFADGSRMSASFIVGSGSLAESEACAKKRVAETLAALFPQLAAGLPCNLQELAAVLPPDIKIAQHNQGDAGAAVAPGSGPERPAKHVSASEEKRLITELWVTVFYTKVRVWGSVDSSGPRACVEDLRKLFGPSADEIREFLHEGTDGGKDINGLVTGLESALTRGAVAEGNRLSVERCAHLASQLLDHARLALAHHTADPVQPSRRAIEPGQERPYVD